MYKYDILQREKNWELYDFIQSVSLNELNKSYYCIGVCNMDEINVRNVVLKLYVVDRYLDVSTKDDVEFT